MQSSANSINLFISAIALLHLSLAICTEALPMNRNATLAVVMALSVDKVPLSPSRIVVTGPTTSKKRAWSLARDLSSLTLV